MSFLTRTARSTPRQSIFSQIRFNSTQSSPVASSSTTTTTTLETSPSIPKPAASALADLLHQSPRYDPQSSSYVPADQSALENADASKVPPPDVDAWWKGSVKAIGHPGNQYTGRSLPVRSTGLGFIRTFRRLTTNLRKENIRTELRRAEFYEKPSETRRRLISERHRRRFQEEVRRRVQMVQTIRNRE
ncbi:small subunit ribosomal protein MRP21, partial [Tremellales sp. Uapishka_1]